MSNCTQQSANGEVVVVREQSIHERIGSNAKEQIAKGNEMVTFKIGDQVLYSLSHSWKEFQTVWSFCDISDMWR